MRILIAGANGLVGTALTEHCRERGDEVLAHGRLTLDITDRDLIARVIGSEKPDAVINCAAWTDVDACESDHERAFAVNTKGPENLAAACDQVGAAFVTISTDYVFDGTKGSVYTQLDQPNPQSVYGVSKLEGELLARHVYSKAIIARTGFVFGKGGTNFLSTIVDRVRNGKTVKVIIDARGSPTYAPDLAVRLRELVEQQQAREAWLFHLVNSGSEASYEEFARLALQAAALSESSLEPVTVASLERPAPRPANSAMRCLFSESVGLTAMPDWRDALQRFVSDSRPAGSRATA